MQKTNTEILSTNDREFVRILESIYKSLVTGIRSGNTEVAKTWLQERKLSHLVTGACYNSGQLHHKKSEAFRKELEKTGFLTKSRLQTKEGQMSYKVFGKLSVIFPLKNKAGEIVNLYAIGIKDNKTSFLNDEGIYPQYPHIETEELIITPTIIEAATILQAGILKEGQAVISLFDSELKPQHTEIISTLRNLKSLLWIQHNK